MAENEKKYVNINGIDKSFVHEHMGKDKEGNDKPFWSVGVQVPYAYSKNGVVNVTTNVEPKPVKDNPDKVNVGWPAGWNFKDVRIYTEYDREHPENAKFEERTITVEELEKQSIAFRTAMKQRAAEAPAEEAEAEPER